MEIKRRTKTPWHSKSNKVQAFKEKLRQTIAIIDEPLAIFFLRERNPNYVMFTLVEDLAAPAALIIKPDGEVILIVNMIELDMVAHLDKVCSIKLYRGMGEFYKLLREVLPAKGKIYVETADQVPDLDLLPRRFHERLSSWVQLLSAQDILVTLRSTKTNSEISFINEAVKKTLKIFSSIAPVICAGTTEEEIAHEIMCSIIRSNGGISFPPIVSSGPRVVNPHPVRHTKRKLGNGDWLIIDFGMSLNGYTSDLTRTFLIGGDYQQHPFMQTYNKMLQLLHDEDFTRTTPHAFALKLRKIAENCQVDKFEKHGYGHGLGTAIHDIYPSIATYKGCLSEIKCDDGAVFTFEPGFYDDRNDVGFRIENDFFIKNGKAVQLG